MKSSWFHSFFDRRYVDLLVDQKPSRQTDHEVRFLKAALGLRRGDRVLDCPCGYGRHAARLARGGIEVVGVDLSPAMIAEGRRRFGAAPRLTLARGDMRKLAYDGEFDAVVNLFTAFGYFSEAEDRRVVRGYARALKPGGKLMVDHRDPVFDRRQPSRQSWWRAGRDWVLDESRFEKDTLYLRWTLLRLGDRRARVRTAQVREYTLGAWRAMLRQAGLRLLEAYSDYDGSTYRPGRGPRLIVVAGKPDRPRHRNRLK